MFYYIEDAKTRREEYETEYEKLVDAVRKNESAENLAALGEWFSHNGTRWWNGEYYDVEELDARLYPIEEPDEVDENGEPETWKIIGWKLK